MWLQLIAGIILNIFAVCVNCTCPLHTIPARAIGLSSNICVCVKGNHTICTGPLCRLGKGDVLIPGQEYVLGFPNHCDFCDCKAMSPSQRRTVPLTTWDDKQLYYHLHISKTGGTTLERILKDMMTSDDIRPPGMTMCQTERHPFSKPPFFADPVALEESKCNDYRPRICLFDLLSLFCQLVMVAVISAEARLHNIDKQIPFTTPHMIILLRHPILRTLSQYLRKAAQFHHDRIKERTLSRMPWRGHFTLGHDTLQDLYLNTSAHVDKRYRNWQTLLLSHPKLTYPEALKDMTFIGITEFYKTSMCLFYFTFQLPTLLHNCQHRPLDVFNKACHGECSMFKNEINTTDALQDNHESLADSINKVDRLTQELISKFASLDMQLYNAALDIFWRRVAVMEAVVGERFFDLPGTFHTEDPSANLLLFGHAQLNKSTCKVSIMAEFSLFTFNILSPLLTNKEAFPNISDDLLDEEYRKEELSHSWFGDFMTFFDREGYLLIPSLYSPQLGIAIAFPRDLFSLIAVKCQCIGSTLPDDWEQDIDVSDCIGVKSMDSFEQLISFAKYRKNTALLAHFACKKSGFEFCVSTYHMPCRFKEHQFMAVHLSALFRWVHSESGSLPYVIAGDFNITPDSSWYSMTVEGFINPKDIAALALPTMTFNEIPQPLKSAIKIIAHLIARNSSKLLSRVHRGQEAPFTNWTETFKGALDYIFYSPGLDVLCAAPLLENAEGPFPTIDVPSDHLPLYAKFRSP
eukprot:gene4251-6577_t